MKASVYFSVYLNTAGGPAQSGSEVVCDTCSIVFLSVYLNVVTVGFSTCTVFSRVYSVSYAFSSVFESLGTFGAG